jgi:hypothetical protein
MVMHRISADDRRFRTALETCALPPAEFDHRAHVRLAYVLLAEHDDDGALVLMRDMLRAFIVRAGADPSKYHETITRAWLLAVRHFMQVSAPCASADDFITANPALLDARIMLTHYSAKLLFSEEARARFVEPDIQRIPTRERGLP